MNYFEARLVEVFAVAWAEVSPVLRWVTLARGFTVALAFSFTTDAKAVFVRCFTTEAAAALARATRPAGRPTLDAMRASRRYCAFSADRAPPPVRAPPALIRRRDFTQRSDP